MENKFEIEFLKDAKEYLYQLDQKTLLKVLYNIDKAKQKNDPTQFKKLTTEIWEFRTNYGGLQHRLLAFWDKTGDKQTLVVATHGFVKKTEKVPIKEIEKATTLRQQYFDSNS